MKPFYNYHRIGQFLLINAIIAFVISLFFIFGDTDGLEWYTAKWLEIFFLHYFLYSFLISSLLSGGINLLIEFSGKHFPWLESPLKRLVFDLLAVIAYTFVVSFLLTAIFAFYFWNMATIENVNWASIVSSTKLPILIALGFTFFFTSRSFFYEWRQAAIEAEQMKTDRLAGQYQSLKDQLNPHFLFNSLNVLSNLVYEDAEKSSEFIDKLAKVYRYVLDVQDESLVSLSRELEFASSYLQLQEVRFGNKLRYEINVEKQDGVAIPPLSLQLLLENVVKHNSATTQSPLEIKIYIREGMLVVENNLQKRESPGVESGIGLNNIRERYRYFTDKAVTMSEDNGIFTVSIPLLASEE